jgi:hypothetical protein
MLTNICLLVDSSYQEDICGFTFVRQDCFQWLFFNIVLLVIMQLKDY